MTNVTVLPVPGTVEPAPGVGVTIHEGDFLFPATILRVGLGIFWCRADRDSAVNDLLPPAMREWIYRVVRQPDGTWRTDEMRRVDVGARRVRAGADPVATDADRLAAKVARIEPSLLKRRWYPMTHMAIPGVLRSADELLAELAAYSGSEKERVAALHERLTALRKGFRNIGGGMAPAATDS